MQLHSKSVIESGLVTFNAPQPYAAPAEAQSALPSAIPPRNQRSSHFNTST